MRTSACKIYLGFRKAKRITDAQSVQHHFNLGGKVRDIDMHAAAATHKVQSILLRTKIVNPTQPQKPAAIDGSNDAWVRLC